MPDPEPLSAMGSADRGLSEAPVRGADPNLVTLVAKDERNIEPAYGKHMALVAFGNIVPPAAAIVTAPILARSLGVLGRGDVAAATAPLLLAMFVSTFGIPDAMTFYIARQPQWGRRYLKLAAMMLILPAVVSTVALIALTPLLSAGEAHLANLMVVSSCALPVVLGVTLLRALAAAQHRWRLVASEQVVSALIRVVAIVAIVVFGRLTVLEATVVVAAAPYIGVFVYLRRDLLPRSSRPSPTHPVPPRSMANFGLKVWLGAVSGVLLLRLDQTLLTPLSSATELGLYAVAANISEVTLVVNNAVRDVSFVASAQRQPMGAVTRSARVSGTVSLLLASVIAVCVPFGVPAVFGHAFRAAVPSTLLLLAAVAAGTPGSVAGAELTGSGHPGKRSISLLIAALVNVALLIPLVYAYGAVGAAWATFAGNLTASNANIYFLWRMHGVSPLAFYGLRNGDLDLISNTVKARLFRVPVSTSADVPPVHAELE